MTAGSNWLSWAPPNFLSNLETEYAPDDTYSLLTVASLYCLAFRVGFSGRSCYGTARNQDNSRWKHETIHVEMMLSILTHRIYKINKYTKANAINDINIVNPLLGAWGPMDPKRDKKSCHFFLERVVATKFQVFLETPIVFNFMWHIDKFDDRCQGYDVMSWRHARRQTFNTSISGTTCPRILGLVAISGFSKSDNPTKCNANMSNRCMTSYVTSWRHAWRQTDMRSVVGTTHHRSVILVSILGFSGLRLSK